MKGLSLLILTERLAICKLPPGAPAPQRPAEAHFWSVTCTDQEMSVVLPEEDIQAGWVAETGWRAVMVTGPLDFGLTGVLASLALPLARPGVSIFAISTYETDYVLVRKEDLEKARQVLTRNGHRVLDR